LKAYAVSLGGDVPFFIDCQPGLASGRGEIIKPLNIVLNGLYIVLVNPGILISTREAYVNCNPATPEKSLNDLVTRPVSEWKNLITNDFEKTVFLKNPEIKSIKQALYDNGALYSSMSGSGSAVYGIFHKKPVISGKLIEKLIYEGEL
jgi:4-diphosphocytidyl-2-C-methyl-D-erythritol kinase